MSAKHTPGPWSLGYTTDDEVSIRINGKGHLSIATVVWRMYGSDKSPKMEANAHLITAAPDLLEVCRSIENDSGTIPEAIWNLRNAAIAKAEGSQ